MTSNSRKLNIALAFSGGGYRAATFSLGTISYLDQIIVNGTSLLSQVDVLSTVSGGTVTGTKYALGLKQGKQFSDIYKSLYKFMSEEDLIAGSMDRLISENGWDEKRVKSLINAIADVYNKELFDGARFGKLLEEEPQIHLKHISFNATEFANALQFRFQCSEKLDSPGEGEPESGIIGNYYYRVPAEIAGDIRMADILAASSCFPGGFEPINFPTDFIFSKSTNLSDLTSNDYPVGLMDGGIVDNQGVGPILLAEARMKRNQMKRPADDGNILDLIIVADVASPYMDKYSASIQQKKNWWRNLTPAWIFGINILLLFASGYYLYEGIDNSQTWLIVISSVVLTINLIVFLLARIIKSIPVKFQVPKAFMKPLGKLLRLKLQVYENLIMNRTNSVLKMTGEVFLKHIRRLNYGQIFNDPLWRNRRIMTAIYELREGEKKILEKTANGSLPDFLVPSDKVQKVSTKASQMGTTLWFTKEELEKDEVYDMNMLDYLIACGQFTMCWNLMEYIGKLEIDKKNTTAAHQQLMNVKSEIRNHWDEFQKDPFWLVRQYQKSSQLLQPTGTKGCTASAFRYPQTF